MSSINAICNTLAPSSAGVAVGQLLNSLLADVTALHASVVAITAKLDVATAKLNSDGGVTDTNYAVDFASACDPAALTTTA